MNENGKKSRDFVWTLKSGEAVTYGYIAEKLNREGARGVGSSIGKGARENALFPWWRVVSAQFEPMEGGKEKLIKEGWKFEGDLIDPSMRDRVKRSDS